MKADVEGGGGKTESKREREKERGARAIAELIIKRVVRLCTRLPRCGQW